MAKYMKNPFNGDKTLAELDDSFEVMENSQDIEAMREYFPDIPEDATLVAAQVDDGEYGEVYYSDSNTPYMNYTPMFQVK